MDYSVRTQGNSGSLSGCLKEVKCPFELQGGVRDCSGVSAGESGLNSQERGDFNVFLELRVAAGNLGSFELRQGPDGASHLVFGKSGILLSCEGSLGISLELVQGMRASSRVKRGNSGLLSSCDMDWCSYGDSSGKSAIISC